MPWWESPLCGGQGWGLLHIGTPGWGSGDLQLWEGSWKGGETHGAA